MVRSGRSANRTSRRKKARHFNTNVPMQIIGGLELNNFTCTRAGASFSHVAHPVHVSYALASSHVDRHRTASPDMLKEQLIASSDDCALTSTVAVTFEELRGAGPAARTTGCVRWRAGCWRWSQGCGRRRWVA
jgi:hypothetical protein